LDQNSGGFLFHMASLQQEYPEDHQPELDKLKVTCKMYDNNTETRASYTLKNINYTLTGTYFKIKSTLINIGSYNSSISVDE
jgi:hypothetical protein